MLSRDTGSRFQGSTGLQDFTSEYKDVVDDTIESVIEQLPLPTSFLVQTTEEREFFHQEATLKLDPAELSGAQLRVPLWSLLRLLSQRPKDKHAIPVEEPLRSADAVPSRFAQMAFQASQQVGEDVADQDAEFPLDGDTEFEEKRPLA